MAFQQWVNKYFTIRVLTVHKFKYGKPEDTGIRMPIFEMVGKKMLQESIDQGYGRHSMNEG